MTTSDWALVISCFSMLIALGSFLWNVWSTFIYPKPRVRVTIAIMTHMPNPENRPSIVSISATNFGPNEVTLRVVVTRARKGFFARIQHRFLIPLDSAISSTSSQGPLSGGLPKSLSVGEEFSCYFPISREWLDDGLYRFGYGDTFGRVHWCSWRNSRHFLKRLAARVNLESPSESASDPASGER